MVAQEVQDPDPMLVVANDCFEAAKDGHSYPVQLAVCCSCTEQAALVVCFAELQHCQQAGVRQSQQHGLCW
jgi:hypothetical protein